MTSLSKKKSLPPILWERMVPDLLQRWSAGRLTPIILQMYLAVTGFSKIDFSIMIFTD